MKFGNKVWNVLPKSGFDRFSWMFLSLTVILLFSGTGFSQDLVTESTVSIDTDAATLIYEDIVIDGVLEDGWVTFNFEQVTVTGSIQCVGSRELSLVATNSVEIGTLEAPFAVNIEAFELRGTGAVSISGKLSISTIEDIYFDESALLTAESVYFNSISGNITVLCISSDVKINGANTGNGSLTFAAAVPILVIPSINSIDISLDVVDISGLGIPTSESTVTIDQVYINSGSIDIASDSGISVGDITDVSNITVDDMVTIPAENGAVTTVGNVGDLSVDGGITLYAGNVSIGNDVTVNIDVDNQSVDDSSNMDAHGDGQDYDDLVYSSVTTDTSISLVSSDSNNGNSSITTGTISIIDDNLVSVNEDGGENEDEENSDGATGSIIGYTTTETAEEETTYLFHETDEFVRYKYLTTKLAILTPITIGRMPADNTDTWLLNYLSGSLVAGSGYPVGRPDFDYSSILQGGLWRLGTTGYFFDADRDGDLFFSDRSGDNDSLIEWVGNNVVSRYELEFHQDLPVCPWLNWIEKNSQNIYGAIYDRAVQDASEFLGLEDYSSYVIDSSEELKNNTDFSGIQRVSTSVIELKRLDPSVYADIRILNSGTVYGCGDYEPGVEVTLVAVAERGFRFSHWTNENGDTYFSPEINFIMPDCELKLEAVFEQQPLPGKPNVFLTRLDNGSNPIMGFTPKRNAVYLLEGSNDLQSWDELSWDILDELVAISDSSGFRMEFSMPGTYQFYRVRAWGY